MYRFATSKALTFMDPRLVPPLRFANVWPAVPETFLVQEHIRHALPKSSQVEAGLIQGDSHTPTDVQVREAAVLIGLAQREHGLTVLLTQRPQSMPTHAGQIAFPGGKWQESDSTAEEAALREAHEEIGLHIQDVTVLGRLPVYCTRSGFRIHPVIGVVSSLANLHADPREVDEIFEIPLSFFMNGRFHRMHRAEHEGKTWSWWSMPYQQTLGAQTIERFVWGATAGMLRNFYLVMLHHAQQNPDRSATTL